MCDEQLFVTQAEMDSSDDWCSCQPQRTRFSKHEPHECVVCFRLVPITGAGMTARIDLTEETREFLDWSDSLKTPEGAEISRRWRGEW